MRQIGPARATAWVARRLRPMAEAASWVARRLRSVPWATPILLTVGGVALLSCIYQFLATAGHMGRYLHVGVGYYEQLAVAFVDGHVDLVQRPDPGESMDGLRSDYWDLSFDHGHLYLYWGPVPALIGAFLLREFDLHVSDDPLTLGLAVARAVFGTMILLRAKRLFFPAQPLWPTVLGIVTLALGAPLWLLCGRPAVYEAAIAGGQCFLLAGTYAAFVALTRPRDAWTRVLFGLASLALGLAIACRLALAPAAAAIAGLTLAAGAGDAPVRQRVSRSIGDAIALGAPIAATIGLLAVYDQVRFGSALDSGLSHQLSIWTFHNGLRFVVPNAYSYIVRPPLFTGTFPFVRVSPWHADTLFRTFPALSLHSTDIDFEPNAGCLWQTPFYAFAAVAWIALGRWTWRAVRRRSFAVVGPAPRLAWLAAASLAIAALGLAPCLTAFVSAVRYFGDAAAGVAIGATLGLSLAMARPLRGRLARTRRGAVAAAAFAAVLVSFPIGFSLWVDGPYGDFLRSQNRPLFDSLSHVFGGRS